MDASSPLDPIYESDQEFPTSVSDNQNPIIRSTLSIRGCRALDPNVRLLRNASNETKSISLNFIDQSVHIYKHHSKHSRFRDRTLIQHGRLSNICTRYQRTILDSAQYNRFMNIKLPPNDFTDYLPPFRIGSLPAEFHLEMSLVNTLYC